MVAVKSFAAGCALSPAGAHAAHMSLLAVLAQMNLPPQVAQYANAEPRPERQRAVLDLGWRGDMPRTVWIGRDGAREARSGLLAADVLDGWLLRAKR